VKRSLAAKVPVPLEADVQRQVLALLKLRGILVWRNNTGMLPGFGKGGKTRPIKVGLGKGSADVIGLLSSGRFLAIECKRPGERPTAEQTAWLNAVNDRGAFACWVDRIETLQQALDLLGGNDGRRLAVWIEDDGTQRLSYRS
jgi:hypothetical protein